MYDSKDTLALRSAVTRCTFSHIFPGCTFSLFWTHSWMLVHGTALQSWKDLLRFVSNGSLFLMRTTNSFPFQLSFDNQMKAVSVRVWKYKPLRLELQTWLCLYWRGRKDSILILQEGNKSWDKGWAFKQSVIFFPFLFFFFLTSTHIYFNCGLVLLWKFPLYLCINICAYYTVLWKWSSFCVK